LKNLIIAFFVFISAYAAHQHPDPPSVHGMLVVGKGTIYLSHLPMFHSPHDYQVILEAEFDPASSSAYAKSLKSHAEPVYTIAPETGVLAEMAQVGRSFKAELFRGHFEREGVPLGPALVTIKKVVYFRKFDPLALKPPGLELVLFGNAQEQFAAHVIQAKPDFDQVLGVETKLDLEEGAVVKSYARAENAPLKQQQTLTDLKVKKVFYTETGDLSF
jgi:hypothetical protein